MQSRNRFLNEYENYCIIKRLLELNSPGLNQNVSLARRRVIHVRRVAALRDLISVP